MFCSGTLYLGVVLSYFLGDKLFNYLAGSLSYTVLLIWLLISVAAFVLVRKQKKMGYTIFLGGAILALLLLFAGILITNPLAVTGFTALLYTIIFLSFYWNHRKMGNQWKKLKNLPLRHKLMEKEQPAWLFFRFSGTWLKIKYRRKRKWLIFGH